LNFTTEQFLVCCWQKSRRCICFMRSTYIHRKKYRNTYIAFAVDSSWERFMAQLVCLVFEV